MPNIKLYGFTDSGGGLMQMPVSSRQVSELIFRHFAGAPFLNDLVVTVVHSDVFGSEGILKPYAEVCSMREDEQTAIMKVLLDLGIEVEVPNPLADFCFPYDAEDKELDKLDLLERLRKQEPKPYDWLKLMVP